VVTWQLFTEPGAGSDLAGLKTTAIRDGDEFVVNGEKIFVGGLHDVDQFWLLAQTEPDGPRHKNLGMFIVPFDLPGITITALDLIAAGGEGGVSPGQKNRVEFEDVRVSAACLIGPETNGWGVANSTLEIEHGGSGGLFTHRVADRFINYCRTDPDMVKRLKAAPELCDSLIDVYIDAQVERLFALRNYWIRHAKQQRTYEGNQYSYFRKMFGVRMAKAMMDILGPYALTNDELRGIEDGAFECHQRAGIITAPGGSAEIQKVRMARRIGIGRATKEQASAAT
jgi:alkylation response protein AidB-like acyl-CoA dehydrogenase